MGKADLQLLGGRSSRWTQRGIDVKKNEAYCNSFVPRWSGLGITALRSQNYCVGCGVDSFRPTGSSRCDRVRRRPNNAIFHTRRSIKHVPGGVTSP